MKPIKLDKKDLDSYFEIFESKGFDFRYDDGYTRYFGTGHHLFFLVENYDESRLLEIMSRNIHPSLMIGPLKEISGRANIVMLDVELGGVSVW